LGYIQFPPFLTNATIYLVLLPASKSGVRWEETVSSLLFHLLSGSVSGCCLNIAKSIVYVLQQPNFSLLMKKKKNMTIFHLNPNARRAGVTDNFKPI